MKKFSSGPTWLAGEVTKNKGQCSYEVTLSDGRTIHRHRDHIRVRTVTTDQSTSMTDIDDPLMDPGAPLRQTAELRQETSQAPPMLRRSNHNRRPPDRFTC